MGLLRGDGRQRNEVTHQLKGCGLILEDLDAGTMSFTPLGRFMKVFTVHIAGSKGKGSTSAMLASTLRQAGYRTGMFTSPHLTRVEERFQIDGALFDVRSADARTATFARDGHEWRYDGAVLYRDVWRKPVIYDEVRYEGNSPRRWGQLKAEELDIHELAGRLALDQRTVRNAA